MLPCIQVAGTMVMGAEHEVTLPAPQDNGLHAPAGVCVGKEQYDMIANFQAGGHAQNSTWYKTMRLNFSIHIFHALVVLFGCFGTADWDAKVSAREKKCSMV